MRLPRMIAIDGPAGVGKSTIGKCLADRLGYIFLDTGALYRAVTLVALRSGVPASDEAALAALAETLDLEFLRPLPGSGQLYRVFSHGEDITTQLRSEAVEEQVSVVSAHPRVRAALLERQRQLARTSPSILVGRDIGTVVLPEADLKLFLDASLEERAARRYSEVRQRGHEVAYEEVLHDLQTRDRLDSERATSPLKAAADAVRVDTNGKDVQTVMSEIESRLACE